MTQDWEPMPAALSFRFIGNACGVFTGPEGTTILCDPWIVDGVFDGSWFHYPPLATTLSDLQDVDAIYLSHLHPDHFDERNFRFSKSTRIIVLDHGPNFLLKKLQQLGYQNLITVKDGETVPFKEFELTLFAPFAKHNFHYSEVGNLIDSAILFSSNGLSALNTNDNTLTLDAAHRLVERFGQFDLAMLNYNAAGPYPSCFDNLSEQEKFAEHERILKRNFDHVLGLLKILNPRAFLPFAGAYVLAGRQNHKNAYLGTTTWDACASYIRDRYTGCKTITLREGTSFNLATCHADREYQPIDLSEMKSYITGKLATVSYPYESDPVPVEAEIVGALELAAKHMHSRMLKYGIRSKKKVYSEVFGNQYEIYPRFAQVGELVDDRLECRLDERLLWRILRGISHWNNAEIGGHIDFVRTPNDYDPDLHIGLQFLHV